LFAYTKVKYFFDYEVAMQNENKTKAQLIHDLSVCQQKITEQDAREVEYQQTIKTLQKERDQYLSVLDSLPAHIAIKNTQSHYVFANSAMQSQLGINRVEKVIGKTDFDFYPPDIAKKNFNHEQEIIRSGKDLIDSEEVSVDNTTGKQHWSHSTKVQQQNSEGEVTGIVTISHDITGLKQVQFVEAEQRLLAETMHDITLTIISTLNLDDVLERILDYVKRVAPHDTANIMLNEGDFTRVVHAVGYEILGIDSQDVLEDTPFEIATVPSLEHVLITGQPNIIPDVSTYSGWKVRSNSEWIRSQVGVNCIFPRVGLF
jgi:PAS domain S-box-containing protein